MSKLRIAQPPPNGNVIELRPAEPSEPSEGRVVIELQPDAAEVHLVVLGELFPVARITGGGERSRLVAARVYGEQMLAEVVADG